MIGKLRGIVDGIGDGHVVLDVGGVGYVAHCPSGTLASLVPGDPAVLLIETYVREDMIRLFGFATHEEREWFRILQSVQGVGSKVALAILGALSPGELAAAIANEDKVAMGRAQGVGPKLAMRLASELRGKVPADLMDVAAKAPAPVESGPASDASSALANLGYPRAAAHAAVLQAQSAAGAEATMGELVRAGLRILSRAA